MESAHSAVWNPRSGMASRRKPCISSRHSRVYHQGGSLVYHQPRAASFPVILSLSKFCEREASKTEEQSDEGISPDLYLGIMKTNGKSACRAASIRPRSDRERSPFGFRLRAPPSAQDDSGRCVPCRINQTNVKSAYFDNSYLHFRSIFTFFTHIPPFIHLPFYSLIFSFFPSFLPCFSLAYIRKICKKIWANSFSFTISINLRIKMFTNVIYNYLKKVFKSIKKREKRCSN